MGTVAENKSFHVISERCLSYHALADCRYAYRLASFFGVSILNDIDAKQVHRPMDPKCQTDLDPKRISRGLGVRTGELLRLLGNLEMEPIRPSCAQSWPNNINFMGSRWAQQRRTCTSGSRMRACRYLQLQSFGHRFLVGSFSLFLPHSSLFTSHPDAAGFSCEPIRFARWQI